MWNIAQKHGIELNELLLNNPQIQNPNFIFPGQIINIPSTNASTYTVISGDTTWHIAQKHGIELNELLLNNPQIQNPNFIFPGQIINIPSTTITPNIPTGPSIPSGTNNIRALETEVIRLVNVERANAGIPALNENEELSRVARIKSQDFIDNNYFSHNSPVYGSAFEMLRTFGISFNAAAENIASGQGTAREVVNSWMSSPGHRANILNSTYNQIGVGVARENDGNLLWTQMFIRS